MSRVHRTWEGMPRMRAVALFLIGLCALLACAAFVLCPPVAVTLQSRPIAALPPHVHGTGDSLLDPGHAVYATSTVYTLPEGFWVTSISYRVHNAPNAVLHHADLLDVSRKSQTCPSMPLVLASVDRQTSHEVRFPAPYGLYLPAGSKLYLDAMFHNPDYPVGPGGTYTDVSVDITVHGTRAGGALKELVPLYLGLSDQPSCPPLTFTVPPGPSRMGVRSDEARYATYTFPTCGDIVLHGAHVHPWDGGDALYLLLNGTVRAVDRPQRIGSEEWDWSQPVSFERIAVKKGDTIALAARYQNPLPVPEPGEMGIELLFYHPDSTCETTTLARAN